MARPAWPLGALAVGAAGATVGVRVAVAATAAAGLMAAAAGLKWMTILAMAPAISFFFRSEPTRRSGKYFSGSGVSLTMLATTMLLLRLTRALSRETT